MVQVAPGELIDKVTIPEIKRERIRDAVNFQNVRTELALLATGRDGAIAPSREIDRLTADVKKIHELLWEIEDEIRDCDRRGEFGERFIELARSVYRSNDRRSAVKRQINELLGSRLVEEKSYTAYWRRFQRTSFTACRPRLNNASAGYFGLPLGSAKFVTFFE